MKLSVLFKTFTDVHKPWFSLRSPFAYAQQTSAHVLYNSKLSVKLRHHPNGFYTDAIKQYTSFPEFTAFHRSAASRCIGHRSVVIKAVVFNPKETRRLTAQQRSLFQIPNTSQYVTLVYKLNKPQLRSRHESRATAHLLSEDTFPRVFSVQEYR